VAYVKGVLHVRIFDANGKEFFYKSEDEIIEQAETDGEPRNRIDELRTQIRELKDLGRRLIPLRERPRSEEVEVLAAVSSLVGSTPQDFYLKKDQANAGKRLSEIAFTPSRRYSGDSWILGQVCGSQKGQDEIVRDEIVRVAKGIVRFGGEGVMDRKGIPVLQIGELLAVDRRETEAYRGIQATIEEYIQQIAEHTRRLAKVPLKPLNLAVFGPPGSGKTFGIRQMAEAAQKHGGGEAIEKKEFNLSQFDQPDALHGALHQVRDLRLEGKLPLVVWDEFDTTLDEHPLGWLRYFLAPMWDGRFEQRDVTHPVGPCIFVFAGGTCSSREEFEKKSKAAWATSAKAPDFISRLHGFLDVLGPNPQPNEARDPLYLIRRAFLLRSLFERHAGQLFTKTDRAHRELRIDNGVLNALLRAGSYLRGARSIQILITTSALAGKREFDLSSLPAESALKLHINNVHEFMCLLNEDDQRPRSPAGRTPSAGGRPPGHAVGRS
jgi:hypothetical protein